ncbi:MAG: type II toxin-antitoxin system RatA family toxin [Rhodobacteraceae bacterium]|nr:type II toxin-antitoxin system RatA family toxin [Paracoccaceae bacterium]
MPRHREERWLPYPPELIYDLVADIESYPAFIPWCEVTRIRNRREGDGFDRLEADLIASFKVYRARLSSVVDLHHDHSRIVIAYLDGPLRHLDSSWRFQASRNGCRLLFEVDFEFRNAVLRKLAGVVFTEAMHRIAGAFEARARDLYGQPDKSDQNRLA